MRRTLPGLVCLLAIPVVLAINACEINRSDAIKDLSVITTTRDEAVDFGALTTFALNDELIEVGEDLDIDHSKDFIVFAAIRGNLLARGYTEIADGADPSTADLVVIGAVTTRNWTTTSSGCWGWSGCWYYPCYPYYCQPVTSVAFTEGMLLIVAFDTARLPDPSEEEASTAWLALQAGYVENIATINDVVEGVDQAFKQSPYFRRNP